MRSFTLARRGPAFCCITSLPLLDARGAEVVLTTIALATLHDNTVAEGAVECCLEVSSSQQRLAFQKTSGVDALQEIKGTVVKHIVVEGSCEQLVLLAVQ